MAPLINEYTPSVYNNNNNNNKNEEYSLRHLVQMYVVIKMYLLQKCIYCKQNLFTRTSVIHIKTVKIPA